LPRPTSPLPVSISSLHVPSDPRDLPSFPTRRSSDLGFVAKGNAVAGDDRAAEREAGHWNHFDIRNGQRDTDNGDCLPCCGNNVANRKLQARNQEPNEVADSAKTTSTAGGLDNTAAKGPQRVACHAETSHTCRNGHNEHTGDDAC